MSSKYIPTIKRRIDSKIWKDPQKAWNDLCETYKTGYETRAPFGTTIEMPCSPDPRDIAKNFLRRGRLLEKHEKQRYGIHPNTIIGDIIFEYFTPTGIPDCLKHTLDLAYTIDQKVYSINKRGEMPKIPIVIPILEVIR